MKHELLTAKKVTAKLEFLTKNASVDTVPSGIFLPSSRLFKQLDGTEGSETLTAELFRSRYATLNRHVLDANIKETLFPALARVEELCEDFTRKGIVPLVLTHFAYHVPSLDWLHDGADERRLEGVSPDMLVRRETAMAGPLLPRRCGYAFQREESVFRGRRVPIIISRMLFFSNLETVPEKLQIDFGDGNGSRIVSWEEEVTVEYPKPGRYAITIEIPSGGNGKRIVRTAIAVRATQAEPDETWPLSSGEITVHGKDINASGTASVYFNTTVPHYSKVILIADGFSAGGSRLYDDLQNFGFMQRMRDGGFDVILLTYDDATTYIQANGKMAIQAISQIAGYNPSTFICAGVSMGGLVIRYALAYMEKNGQDHKANVYFSFDTPHQGVAIPLGVQHHVRCAVAMDLIQDDMEDLVNLLDCVAAQQMMRFYLPPDIDDLDNLDYDEPVNALRQNFLDDLNAIGGYPTRIRKCAVANGNALGHCVTPTAVKAVRWEAACGTDGYASSCPGILEGDVCVSSFIDAASSLRAILGDHLTLDVEGTVAIGYDSAPGGTTDWWQQLANGLDASASVEAAHADYPDACFVSTVSALDIPTLADSPSSPLGSNFENDTVFDSCIASAINTPHATMTYAIVTFLCLELSIVSPERGINYIKATSLSVSSDDGGSISDKKDTVDIADIIPAGKQPTSVWAAMTGFKLKYSDTDHEIETIQCQCSAELKDETQVAVYWNADLEDNNGDDAWTGKLRALVFVECGPRP